MVLPLAIPVDSQSEQCCQLALLTALQFVVQVLEMHVQE